ncbi:lysozyme [Porphyromonadaceae bacterium]
MKTSQKGIDLIKSHEGLRLTAYRCPAGVLTIGYGHTSGVYPNQTITAQQAELFLRDDLAASEASVNRLEGKVPLNQNQFDALVSLVFNIGGPRFNISTLRRKILEQAPESEIRSRWTEWRLAGGKILPGLVRRRADELTLYFS